MTEEKPRKRMSLWTMFSIVLVFFIITNRELYDRIGRAVGVVLEPVIGFGGHYPVLTIMIAGTLMVLLSSVVRHFTTDWLEMAKAQSYMREWQKEFSKARKENNTYRVKKLQDRQEEVMRLQQEMSMRQFKTMPMTMMIFIPIFAWLFVWLSDLGLQSFSAPWNPNVVIFGNDGILPFAGGTSLLPHWILLYSALSIPLGALAQKAMKYFSWKERWQPKHPEVHE